MLRTLSIVLLSAFCLLAQADERSAAQQQLEKARQDVAELQKLLKTLEKEKSSVQQALQQTEREMGGLERDIKHLQEEIKDSESELQRLDGEKKKLQQSRLEQQQLIGIQARAAYQSGRQEPLRLLLNQQRPEQLSRTLTQYEYLGQARLRQLETFNETLRQLANVEYDIIAQQNRLAERQHELQGRRDELAKVRQQRQQALAKLNREYRSRDQRLRARQQEQAEFARVLRTIEETLARQAREAELARQRAAEAQRLAQQSTPGTPGSGPQVSSGSGQSGPFAQAKGKLPWPVDGRLLARYGSPRAGDARSTWDGVLIGASAGSPVRAVHGGRVVFADWLRGAGLLVIIDHGNGYLSLYGHNQSLLKNPGDLVNAGETIATVGSSGGQQSAALYFAIRQQGRPSDPAQWCRSHG